MGVITKLNVHTTLTKLELNSRELSSYAFTHIEGNLLPLTDVKYLLKTSKERIQESECEALKVLAKS